MTGLSVRGAPRGGSVCLWPGTETVRVAKVRGGGRCVSVPRTFTARTGL